MSHIYDNPRLVIIYHPWTFTVVLSFDDFGKVAKFTSSQRQAFGKRPFHISCTRPLTPCGASASKCNCKSNKYLRKYKENLYNLRFLVEFATNNTYLWGLRMSKYHMRQVAGETPTLPVAAHWGLILCKFNLKQCKNILINCDFIVKTPSSCHLCHPFCNPFATT